MPTSAVGLILYCIGRIMCSNGDSRHKHEWAVSCRTEQSCAWCFEERITTGVHDGKISLSAFFSLNVAEGRNSAVMCKNEHMKFRTGCRIHSRYILHHVHLTEYLHSMAKECCPLWLFEWFSLKAEVVETTLYTVNHNNVTYATDKINIPQSWALFLVDLLLFSLCE